MSTTDVILTSLCQYQVQNQYSPDLIHHLTVVLLQNRELVIALRSKQLASHHWQISISRAARLISERIAAHNQFVSAEEFLTRFSPVVQSVNLRHDIDTNIQIVLDAFIRSQSDPDSSRSDRDICRILAASNPMKKMVRHRDVICRVLQQIFIQHEFRRHDLYRIAQQCQVISLYSGDGHQLNEYLTSGSCLILVYGSIKVLDSVEIGVIDAPDIFHLNSLSLDHDAVAELKCETDCIMLMISESDHADILADTPINCLIHRTNIIHQNRIFRQISKSALTAISLSSSYHEIDGNQIIIEQGQPIANKIYVIGSGVVRMIIELPGHLAEAHRSDTCRPRLKPRSDVSKARNRSRPHLDLLPQQTLSYLENAALDLPIRSSLVSTQRNRDVLRHMIHDSNTGQRGVTIELTQLTTADIFGEESLLISVEQHTPEPSQISIISSSGPVWILTIPKHVLIRRLPPDIISRLTSSMKNNMTRRQILFQLEEYERWRTYCNHLPRNALEICTESPACDMGISTLFKHRFWAHRHVDFKPLLQCDESVQARAKLVKVKIESIIDSIELRTDIEASISSLEQLSDEEIKERRAEFTIEGCAELLLKSPEDLLEAIKDDL